MDSYNLKTASTYINNLLLARGLLRDGKPIQFAHPSRGEGGKEVTMAQIINLVHDLILKRDRDQEHREAIAGTLRASRSEATRQTLAIEKLHTRNEDISRSLSLAQSQERSARAALRTAESTARSLREEMARLKTTISQVRTSCANDIRKRDVQLQRLKSHLTTQQRGNKTGLVGASITINPGVTGMAGLSNSARDDVPDPCDPQYSLKQETTEFLTQLSQSLSDENDNLIGLVRSTITTLKELQGMPEGQREHDGDLSTIGEEDENARQSMLQALPTSYDTLASDLDIVLDNLKNLLTNPNFVSIDEVESREEEIVRLRAGWEKMELRLREAFALMETWRTRMANGGDTINLDELKLGLGLGAGLRTVNNEDISVISEEGEGQEHDGASSVFDEELDDAGDLQDPPSPEANSILEKAAAPDLFKWKLQANPPALRESHGNAKSPTRSPRKVAFSASIPNTPSEIENASAETSGLDLVGVEKKPSLTRSTPASEKRTSRSPTKDNRTPRHVRCDDIADQIIKLASKATLSSSPSPSPQNSPLLQRSHLHLASDSDDELQAKKRLSSEAHPDEPSPKLTVQDKLKAAQAEAEAAAVAEGLNVKASSLQPKQDEEKSEDRERTQRGNNRSSPKKTRIGGRPKRRQSTLTPEELDNLLLTR